MITFVVLLLSHTVVAVAFYLIGSRNPANKVANDLIESADDYLKRKAMK